MKKFIVVLAVMMLAVCAQAWADVAINAANFPDEAFRNYVSSTFDKDKNGILSNTEIASIKEITLQNQDTSSLKGIEYFTSLMRLYCIDKKLTTLDLSKNTDLTELYCQGNQLTGLDLSNNKNLLQLSCNFSVEIADGKFKFNLADFQKKFKFDSTWEIANSTPPSVHYADDFLGFTSATLDTSAGTISGTIDETKTFDYVKFSFNTRRIISNSTYYCTVRVYPAGNASSGPEDTSIHAPVITTASPPDGTVGTAYTQTLTALGDTPITWTLASGDLPDGLTLSSSGTISGTPTTAGAFTFTVKAQNSYGTAEKLFTILVPMSDVRPPSFIVAIALPDGFTDTPYGFQLTASGTKPLRGLW